VEAWGGLVVGSRVSRLVELREVRRRWPLGRTLRFSRRVVPLGKRKISVAWSGGVGLVGAAAARASPIARRETKLRMLKLVQCRDTY